MKKLMPLLAMLFAIAVHAQDSLKTVQLPANLTIHFISPEPIQYVDISSKELVGDLPLKNVLRIRCKDSCSSFKDAVVTIAGEKFIAQYHLVPEGNAFYPEINIMPADTHPLDIADIGYSQNQLKFFSMGLMTTSAHHAVERSGEFGIEAQLNHVYTLGDYIFLDLSYRNRTRIKYDIEDFSFRIDDKKVTKASNIQSVEIHPEFVLFDMPLFEKYYRNIFVFKKMTFPGNKLLHITMSEKQLSGRVINLGVSYKDILNADTLPY